MRNMVYDIGDLLYGMAARPVKYKTPVCLIRLILLLNQYSFIIINPLLLFHRARMVLRHRYTAKNRTINNKRITIRAL